MRVYIHDRDLNEEPLVEERTTHETTIPRVGERIKHRELDQLREVLQVVHEGVGGPVRLVTKEVNVHYRIEDEPEGVNFEVGEGMVGVMQGATVMNAECPHCGAEIEEEPLENLDHDEDCPLYDG